MQILNINNIDENIKEVLNKDISFEYTYKSNNIKDTKLLAKCFAKYLKKKDILVLNGKLGAGKTVFMSGIAEYFDILDQISSPTFTIVNEYTLKIMIKFFILMYIELKILLTL